MDLRYKGYSIRPIEESDLGLLLKWRNSERIHSVMLTDHQITWEEHCAWFERNKNNNPARNLIFEYQGRPIGYIGYTEYDEINKDCAPGVYLGEVDVPANAGFVLFYEEVDYGFDVLKMNKLHTETFKDNEKSMMLNKILGFKIMKEFSVQKNGQKKFVCYAEMTAEQWKKKKGRG